MDDNDNENSRFAHLLQPIRDLALNWDIDVASALEDYLEDLDQLSIALGPALKSAVLPGGEDDGEEESGTNSINFAEAALLIQGSALIYSKKVEFLHQLVMKALELLSATRGGLAAASVVGAGTEDAEGAHTRPYCASDLSSIVARSSTLAFPLALGLTPLDSYAAPSWPMPTRARGGRRGVRGQRFVLPASRRRDQGGQGHRPGR